MLAAGLIDEVRYAKKSTANGDTRSGLEPLTIASYDDPR